MLKSLEGVELPHARGGGDGEQEVAGLGVGEAEGEASLVEQVADITKAEEGPENIVLYQGSGASALESEHSSVCSAGERSSCCWILSECSRVFVSDNT